MQPGQAVGEIALKPLPHRLARNAKLESQRRVITSGSTCAADELHSPAKSKPCIFMSVHRSSGGCRLRVQTTPAWCRYDLESIPRVVEMQAMPPMV